MYLEFKVSCGTIEIPENMLTAFEHHDYGNKN